MEAAQRTAGSTASTTTSVGPQGEFDLNSSFEGEEESGHEGDLPPPLPSSAPPTSVEPGSEFEVTDDDLLEQEEASRRESPPVRQPRLSRGKQVRKGQAGKRAPRDSSPARHDPQKPQAAGNNHSAGETGSRGQTLTAASDSGDTAPPLPRSPRSPPVHPPPPPPRPAANNDSSAAETGVSGDTAPPLPPRSLPVHPPPPRSPPSPSTGNHHSAGAAGSSVETSTSAGDDSSTGANPEDLNSNSFRDEKRDGSKQMVAGNAEKADLKTAEKRGEKMVDFIVDSLLDISAIACGIVAILAVMVDMSRDVRRILLLTVASFGLVSCLIYSLHSIRLCCKSE